jgi:quercetin dioxygenase-like cupin family protein
MIAEPVFQPVMKSFDEFVSHDGVLSPGELEDLAQRLAERKDIWEPLIHADPEQRRYELIYEDERMDAWVLSWMPGQGTGFHDHYISSVGLAVASGAVREDMMVYGAEHQARVLRPGSARQGGPGYIHRVSHHEATPAVTVHIYSPRLDWVGQYRLDDDGVVRREVQPGRTELTEQLVAEGALHGVLERF